MFVLQRFISKRIKSKTKKRINKSINNKASPTQQISLKNGSKSYYTKKSTFCDILKTVGFIVKIICFIVVDIFFWSQVNNMFETWFDTTPKNQTTSALIFLLTFLLSIIFNAFLAVIIYSGSHYECNNKKELK